MRHEHGQATIEWVGLIALAVLALGALALAVTPVDGRSYGGFLAHRIVCAVRGAACPDRADDRRLARAYGGRDADLVRRYAPDLVYEPGEREVPVDYRHCRDPGCARTPDDRDLDVHRTDAGRDVTVFTHVVHRHGRTYLQYWFYYPDSNSTVLGADRLWKLLPAPRLGWIRLPKLRYPGFHKDDWEGYEVRVDRRGGAAVRATSHGGLQWCKYAECRGRWGPRTGWTRVSRGSHSGHIPASRTHRPLLPGVDTRERTSTAEGIRLVPLETLDRRRYRRLAEEVSPPWRKALYREPEGAGS